MLVKLGRHGTFRIPKALWADLNETSVVDVVRRDDGVIELHPQGPVDPTQAWFWTEDWQRGEREVDAQYAAGDYEVFDDVESFIADLEAHAGKTAAPDDR